MNFSSFERVGLAFRRGLALLCMLCLGSVTPRTAQAQEKPQVLESRLLHLRHAGQREWSEFAEKPDGKELTLKFLSKRNPRPWTLCLRQQDVKQSWNVSLNGKAIGRLVRDENDMVVCFVVGAGAVRQGENELSIQVDKRSQKTPDDIRVGQIRLHAKSRRALLNAARLEVEVVDGATGKKLPSRITIVNQRGALQATGAESNERLAVRPGVVYTATGQASVGLPPGRYRIYAGRGFEYSLGSSEVVLSAGQTVARRLLIRRQVPTGGYVACDTHVHTRTHSGHGDATVEERMITLAAEGIELPIATDHNVQIDHRPFAMKMKVSRFFTPVPGNEVTTRIGHFNVFPVRAGGSVPDFKLKDWDAILNDIYRTPRVKVAILNHARDVHSGVRPFGPKLFNAVIGENVEGWPIRFNAMEVINSGATQSDPLRLFHDWMALLNRGYRITPVGSSDSHDVARHFVGQGRTYIRCDDRDPGHLDVEQAVNNFIQGRVMVSYGLLADIRIADRFGPGELAPVANGKVAVTVRVLGPDWINASQVTLYANGRPIRKALIPEGSGDLPAGVKWRNRWMIDRPTHDVHLVAIATGPGISGLYWPTAKAYQPTSPDWQARVIGCSGAVWLDADGDGRRTPAHAYAQRLMAASGGKLEDTLARLGRFDRAVAAQVAHLFQQSGTKLLSAEVQSALKGAAPSVRDGFRAYLEAWRKNQLARAGR